MQLSHQSHSASLPLRHGQCDQLTNHIMSVSPSVTVSAINSPITFCQSPPPSRSVPSTHQSHSASFPLRHGQCDQLTNHILPVSPSATVSAINSPITFCQSPPPPRSVRSTQQSHSVSLPLRHGQCDQLTNHILSVSPSATVSAINSPITFCQSPPPPRSVRSTHQSHSVSFPLRHGQCDQLTNHILSVSPSVTVSAINSTITFCQFPPPPRSVRSTHQSHSVSLPLRHGQCDQLTNHILPVSPSATVSVINSPITFCQFPPPPRSVRSTHQSHSVSLPLGHGQCDQLTNHILSVSPSATVNAINSPIIFCQSPPPPRSMRSTQQSHYVSLPLLHGQCDQLTNHILSVSPSATVNAINSPIIFCQSPPPPRSMRSTHQSYSVSLPLHHGQCDQLTNHILSVSPSATVNAINSPIIFCQSPPPPRSMRSTHQSYSVSLPLRHSQFDQLTNHILAVSPFATVSAINSPITFCQSPPPPRSVRSTHQSHSVSLPLRHGQCDQLTNHILSVSPSATVSAINSSITFCQSPPPPRSVRSTHQSHSVSLPLRHGLCDELINHILSVSPSATVSAINSTITFCQSPPPPRSVRSTHQSHSASFPLRHGQCDQLNNHILSVSPSATVSAINSTITFCQSPPPPRSVRSTQQSHSVSFPLRHGQCDQLTNHILSVSPSATVSAINSPITFCQSPPPPRSV